MGPFAPVAFTHTLDRTPSQLLLCSGTLLAALSNSGLYLIAEDLSLPSQDTG